MTWEADATLFGTLERAGKPYKAMLIARCVEPGEGQGARGPRLKSNKVSAREFADHAAGVPSTLLRYLKVWDAMAEDGVVPAREELEPGQDVELPDKEKWTHYYRQVFPSKIKKKDEEPERSASEESSQENAELENVELDMEGATTSPRLGKLYEMADESVQGLSGTVGDQMRRLVDSLADMANDEDPKRAYMRCFHSVTEIASALRAIEA